MVMNKLNDRSGPKIEALIWAAVSELQSGQALQTLTIKIKQTRNRVFMFQASRKQYKN